MNSLSECRNARDIERLTTIEPCDIDDYIADMEQQDELSEDEIEILKVLKDVKSQVEELGIAWDDVDTLIQDHYFVDWCREGAEGRLGRQVMNSVKDILFYVDWEQYAENQLLDYSVVSIGMTEFYFQ